VNTDTPANNDASDQCANSDAGPLPPAGRFAAEPAPRRPDSNRGLSTFCWSVTAILLSFFFLAQLGVLFCFVAGVLVSPFVTPVALLASLAIGDWLAPFGERLRAAGVTFRAVRRLTGAHPMELMSVAPGYPGAVHVCVPEKNEDDPRETQPTP
jgi:hypothetical protein